MEFSNVSCMVIVHKKDTKELTLENLISHLHFISGITYVFHGLYYIHISHNIYFHDAPPLHMHM